MSIYLQLLSDKTYKSNTPSLNMLTPMIFNTVLTYLGSEASIYPKYLEMILHFYKIIFLTFLKIRFWLFGYLIMFNNR